MQKVVTSGLKIDLHIHSAFSASKTLQNDGDNKNKKAVRKYAGRLSDMSDTESIQLIQLLFPAFCSFC